MQHRTALRVALWLTGSTIWLTVSTVVRSAMVVLLD